jgi:acylphosphatase
MSESIPEGAVRAHILVSGRVQGVGYRAFADRVARDHLLVGGVRNLDDGRVELDVEGTKSVIEAMLLILKAGPPAARVHTIETTWGQATNRFSSFSIWA